MLATDVASYPADAGDTKALTARLETALSRSRAHNVGSRVLPEDQPEATRDRLATAARLRLALYSGDGIHPWYQPNVDVYPGTLFGVEALARCQDETRGLVSPGEFLPLADALGLTRQLNRTMLDSVLRDMTGWQANPFTPAPVPSTCLPGSLQRPICLGSFWQCCRRMVCQPRCSRSQLPSMT